MTVADESAIAALPRLKAAAAALADPRTIAPDAAETLIATARPFYYFNAGLHSSETGSPASRPHIETEARRCAYVLGLEPCQPDGGGNRVWTRIDQLQDYFPASQFFDRAGEQL